MVAEAHDGSTPYNLPLSLSLEPESAAGEEGKEEKSKKMPQKEFHFTSPPPGFLPAPLQLPLHVSPSLTLSAPQQQSRKRGMSSSDAPPTDAPQQLGEEGVPLLALASDTSCEQTAPVPLPEPTAVVEALLGRVLRLLDVGSKRFLTNKVDRSVTGLVAQQQCVGPLHTPLADVAVLAQSHFATTGIAVAVGKSLQYFAPYSGCINMDNIHTYMLLTISFTIFNVISQASSRSRDW